MIRVFSQYISPKSLVLMFLESGLIMLALLCGIRLRAWDAASTFFTYVADPGFPLQAALFVGIFQVCFYYCDLYSPSAIGRRNEQLICLGQSLGAGCLLLGFLYFLFPSLVLRSGIFFFSITFAAGFVMLSRLALDRIWNTIPMQEGVAILGTGPLALTVARELTRREDLNAKLTGFLDPHAAGENPDDPQCSLCGCPVWGTGLGLEALVKEHKISRIVVALENCRNALPIRELVKLRVQGIKVEDSHSAISSLTGRVWLETVKPSWFVFSDGFQRSNLTIVLKRSIDLASALLGLVFCSPIMLAVAIAIRIDSKGPIFYRQTRVGLGGRLFEVIKFRSMRVDAEVGNKPQWASANDSRVTRLGRFLRKYRLDEFPQFVNIIRGEMSLIGPRPERPVFVDQLRNYIPYYDERHSVRPGLSGWAQVQYQYGASVEDAARKLEYDLFYLKNMSVLFDLAIIMQTIRIVIGGHGGR